MVVGVADQPELLQRLDHLDPVRPDLEVERPLVHRVRAAHAPLRVAAAHGGVGVDHAEVRVDPAAGDEEDVAGAVVRVVVAAVVEVAVAGRHVAERQRRLVDRVLVERDGLHGGSYSFQGTPASFCSMPARLRMMSSMSSGWASSPKWIARCPVRRKTMANWTAAVHHEPLEVVAAVAGELLVGVAQVGAPAGSRACPGARRPR